VSTYPSRARGLPDFRATVVRDHELWSVLERHDLYREQIGDAVSLRRGVADADLWWVGKDCVDLLAHAAPQIPDLNIDYQWVGERPRMVFFESPYSGVDSLSGERTVPVFAFLLHFQAFIQSTPCVSIVDWSFQNDFFVPLGRSDWIYEQSMEQVFDPTERTHVTKWQEESILDDRRMWAALQVLSSQPLTTKEMVPAERHAARRAERLGQSSMVRVIDLRPSTYVPKEGDEESKRTYHVRWVVNGHWRNQVCGPGRTDRRPTWISAHMAGPEDKPLSHKTKVWSWTR
jgi:hypothetical protein